MMRTRSDTCDHCAAALTVGERPVTVHRHKAGRHFIFEQVPARTCPRCGERYFCAEVARRMQQAMKNPGAKAEVIEVPVISFA
jgi:YgiT-type zinc finger domain-containing protein